MIAESDIRSALLNEKLVDKQKLTQLTKQAKKEGTSLEDVLMSGNLVTEEQLYKTVAKWYRLPYAGLKGLTISQEMLQRIPEKLAEKHEIVVFDESLGEIKLATSKLPDPAVLELVERKLKIPIQISFTSPSDIDSFLRKYQVDVEEEIEKIDPTLTHIDVVELFRGIIENAVKRNASDVHVEPRKKRTVVRYRINGDLEDITTLPRGLHAGVISHIKILSNLKLEEHRQPQDGRFSFSGPGYRVSVRASTVPLLDQEKAVLRILRQDRAFKTPDELGMNQEMIKTIDEVLIKKHGLVLVTGPTGSGKTTTLYTLLVRIDRPEINIATIEDPIEYNFDRVNQSQVNPSVNYSFHVGLRGMLRQDPDVIMVGEIRDQETGSTALRAALTGHMVFSTLHTNDAPSTLTRLREMGMVNYLIASTVNVIIAQRLVKRLCDKCKKAEVLTEQKIKEMSSVLGVDVQSEMDARGIVPEMAKIYNPEGCTHCNQEGFRDRVAIFEMLVNSPQIYSAIVSEQSSKKIEKLAKASGMRTMAEDGVAKVLSGWTTFEELLRVL